MEILYLPGILTDHRLFTPLQKKIGGECIDFIHPIESESIHDYSRRFASQLIASHTAQGFHLISHGFGALVAMEIARQTQLKSLITMNSPGDSLDISPDFRKGVSIGSKLPTVFLKKLLKSKAADFIIQRDKIEPELVPSVRSMVESTQLDRLRWAALATAHWKCPTPYEFSCPHLALHGERDKIIKRPQNMSTEMISEAGHLSPLTHSLELSTRIEHFWKNLPGE